MEIKFKNLINVCSEMKFLDEKRQQMYRFFIDVLKPKKGNYMKIIFADTDGFVFHMRTDDI